MSRTRPNNFLLGAQKIDSTANVREVSVSVWVSVSECVCRYSVKFMMLHTIEILCYNSHTRSVFLFQGEEEEKEEVISAITSPLPFPEKEMAILAISWVLHFLAVLPSHADSNAILCH